MDALQHHTRPPRPLAARLTDDLPDTLLLPCLGCARYTCRCGELLEPPAR